MAKKHWIYIKRGLSEDPKHRAKMGECIWLYMHIIDRADWETGVAYDWKDKEEAAEMGLPVDTLRHQRQKLEENDYIRSSKKQHSQDIAIMEWRNPRDYGSETKNPRKSLVDEFQSSNETPLSEIQSLNQSLNQSSNQPQAQVKTPTLDSISISSSLSEQDLKDVNRKVDILLEFEKKALDSKAEGKSWKLRNSFAFNEHVLALADLCAKRFGEPSKRDLTIWVQEIGSWVDAGARAEDWERAEKIVSGYSGPVVSVTGLTKAIKFASQERKNGTVPVSTEPREEDHPEWKKFVPEEKEYFVPKERTWFPKNRVPKSEPLT